LIHAYAKLYGFRAVALRYANVVGPRLRHGVIWDLINKLKKNPTSSRYSAMASRSGATYTSTTPWRPPARPGEKWLREQGVVAVGRWGQWQYWNTDKVYKNVKETIAAL